MPKTSPNQRRKVKSTTYRHEFADRTGTVTIREEPDRTVIKLRFTKYGPGISERELVEWLGPIYLRYEGDGKPFVSSHPLFDQTAAVFDSGVGLIFGSGVPKH